MNVSHSLGPISAAPVIRALCGFRKIRALITCLASRGLYFRIESRICKRPAAYKPFNHCGLQHPVSSTMGAVTTELVRWVWVAQKPLMGPLWRRAPRSAQPGPPFAHTVPVCSLGCHAVCVLCRQILRGQAAAAPIVSRIAQSMARRRAARARARRAAAAAGGATTGPKVRRGSWHPKPRATHFEDALEKYKR